MENSTNYYVPEREEFHYGFEYKSLYHYGEWKFHIYGHDEEVEFGGMKEAEYIKRYPGHQMVKCLDQSDIESLEFEYKGYNSKTDLFEFRYKNYILSDSSNKDIQIYKMSMIKTKDKPEGYFSEEYMDIVFDGNIKNKSELKKVLEMIGVK